jgi:IS5 family transposase
MRQERTVQASIFDFFADHEIGRELKAMSQWLDEHRELIGLAAEDLRRHGVKETGRERVGARIGRRLRDRLSSSPGLARPTGLGTPTRGAAL